MTWKAGPCFSIEPGICLAGRMAARSEINAMIAHNGQVESKVRRSATSCF